MSAFSRQRFRRLLLAGFCALTATLRSAPEETRFTDSLSANEKTASGVIRLAPEERVALDEQIAREITLARQGDVVAFAKSFGERRTPAQIASAGLARLSPVERTQLDVFVARAVAKRPVPMFRRSDKKEPSDVETTVERLQLHGEISLTYGMASGGRSFYGGSLTTILDDPAHNLTIAFTYAEYHGKGLLPFVACEPLGVLR